MPKDGISLRTWTAQGESVRRHWGLQRSLVFLIPHDPSELGESRVASNYVTLFRNETKICFLRFAWLCVLLYFKRPDLPGQRFPTLAIQ